MESNETRDDELSRRSVLDGIGGVGVASLAGLPAASATGVDVPDDLEVDPHTRDTFRAIVDAIIPRTPVLAAEIGAEHEPGALEIDLEEFLIWNYDNSEELRAEGLSWLTASVLSIDLDEDDLAGLIERVRDEHSFVAGYRLQSLDLTAVSTVFGNLRGLTVDVENTDADAGTVDVEYAITTVDATVDGESDTYPYAPVFATSFDLVALEYIAQGDPEDNVAPNSAFDAGGAFTWLSRRDRLRCLQWLSGGDPVGILEDELSELIAAPETLPGVVMTVHVLSAMGYYSEWAGYGSTKTESPTQRELQTPPDQVQSRQQTGYPGPAPGYAGHRGFEVAEFRENDY